MPAKAVGSDRVGPSRKALVMEKSKASWPPMGPPDVCRTTRGDGGIRRVLIRGAMVVNGVSWDQKAGFSTTVARLALSLAAAPFVHDMSAERAVRVLGPVGNAEATAKADRNNGAGMCTGGSPEGRQATLRLHGRDEGRSGPGKSDRADGDKLLPSFFERLFWDGIPEMRCDSVSERRRPPLSSHSSKPRRALDTGPSLKCMWRRVPMRCELRCLCCQHQCWPVASLRLTEAPHESTK